MEKARVWAGSINLNYSPILPLRIMRSHQDLRVSVSWFKAVVVCNFIHFTNHWQARSEIPGPVSTLGRRGAAPFGPALISALYIAWLYSSPRSLAGNLDSPRPAFS